MAMSTWSEFTFRGHAAMTSSEVLLAPRRTTASHTIGVPHLSELLRYVPVSAPYEAYAHAVVELNILGRPTHTGRLRALRHLRELYLLDDDVTFRLLRVLHTDYPDTLPLLAGLAAVTHDEFLRASWPVVADAAEGEHVTPGSLALAIADEFGGHVSAATYAKAGRNVAASWTQTGHLSGVRVKTRMRVDPTPAAVAFAVALGFLDGRRGPGLLDTVWFALLDAPEAERRAALDGAHRAGLIDVHSAGSVLEVDPGRLLARARDLGSGGPRE